MSYDIGMRKMVMTVEYDIPLFQGTPTYCIELVEVVTSISYTRNVAPMFRRALGGDGLYVLQGASGFMAEPRLRDAVAKMGDLTERQSWLDMNPANGWGDFKGAHRVIHTLLAWSITFPDARIDIW